jgi:hypothetical protein
MLGYYRYFSHPEELKQIVQERRVQGTNPLSGGATWYTTVRYDDPLVAQRELALNRPPTHRIGPVPDLMMPPFDIGPRSAAPLGGHPGGAPEVRTKAPVWLVGLWDFGAKNWVP